MIVGQGIAGSCLALQLIRRNKRVLVFDLPQENHASAVAAGLFNPLTGKVIARTWMADTLFPALFRFYREAETLTGATFFYPQEIYRPFLSAHEQNDWMGKSADPNFAPYVKRIFTASRHGAVTDPFGGILVTQSGHVDVPLFLEKVRQLLHARNFYQAQAVAPEDFIIETDAVTLAGWKAKAVIFCDGMKVASNPYFSWLPINPLKGETITVKMDDLESIVNRGVYVVRKAAGEYTVGATYDFTNQSPGTTAAGRSELSEKLRALVNLPFEITDQHWGIRPTTLDQKIMAGRHPKWPNVLILNGLGTKGVSQAPYFSGQLAGMLDGENEILREVNIHRYKALYSKSG